jgi:hypothetical protein
VTERKDIGLRLENWAKWATRYSGGRGADCMTGAVCERLRKAALGNVWSGHDVVEELDSHDAERIQRAMPSIEINHRFMLNYTYVEQLQPEKVCRLLRIPFRPSSEFVARFRAAQQAIEEAADLVK